MSQGAGKVTATSGGHAPILSVGGGQGGWGRSLPAAVPWPAQPGPAWPFKADLAGPQVRMTCGEGGWRVTWAAGSETRAQGAPRLLSLAPLACCMASV